MNERVTDHLDYRTIQLCRFTFGDQVNLLTGTTSQVAYQTRELGEEIGDRQHPRLHHFVLQLIHNPAEVRRCFAQGTDGGIFTVFQT